MVDEVVVEVVGRTRVVRYVGRCRKCGALVKYSVRQPPPRLYDPLAYRWSP